MKTLCCAESKENIDIVARARVATICLSLNIIVSLNVVCNLAYGQLTRRCTVWEALEELSQDTDHLCRHRCGGLTNDREMELRSLRWALF